MKDKTFQQLMTEAEEVIELSETIEKEFKVGYNLKLEALGDLIKGAVAGLKAFTPGSVVASYKKLYTNKVFSETYAKLDSILQGRDKQKVAIQNLVQKLASGSISDFVENPEELKMALDELRTNAELLPIWQGLKKTLSPGLVTSLEKISNMKSTDQKDEKPDSKGNVETKDSKEQNGTVFQALKIKPFVDGKTGNPITVSKLDPQSFQSIVNVKREVQNVIGKKITDVQARNVFQNVIDTMLVQMFANYDPNSKKSNVDLPKIKRAVNLAIKRTQPIK